MRDECLHKRTRECDPSTACMLGVELGWIKLNDWPVWFQLIAKSSTIFNYFAIVIFYCFRFPLNKLGLTISFLSFFKCASQHFLFNSSYSLKCYSTRMENSLLCNRLWGTWFLWWMSFLPLPSTCANRNHSRHQLTDSRTTETNALKCNSIFAASNTYSIHVRQLNPLNSVYRIQSNAIKTFSRHFHHPTISIIHLSTHLLFSKRTRIKITQFIITLHCRALYEVLAVFSSAKMCFCRL